jgi:hypothetical protein
VFGLFEKIFGECYCFQSDLIFKEEKYHTEEGEKIEHRVSIEPPVVSVYDVVGFLVLISGVVFLFSTLYLKSKG